MRNIVAIGGGSLSERETIGIDRTLRDLTGETRPRVLFLPTASSDDTEYINSFHDVYGSELGCETRDLLLVKGRPADEKIVRQIRAADLIYVGGGNTLKMMRRWRHLGVDHLLREAMEEGTVLAGLSAGALCWFEHGHSDSMYYYNPNDWDYIRVTCLGFISGLGCPHFHGEERVDDFREMVSKHNQIGVAIDDCTALHVRGDKYRVLSTDDEGRIYRVVPNRKEGTNMVSIQHESFRSLDELYVSN